MVLAPLGGIATLYAGMWFPACSASRAAPGLTCAYCIPAGAAAVDRCAAARLRMKKPMATMTAAASKPIITMEASSSPKPRCEAKAAIPRPAARPATGPIQERDGAAAAPAAGAAAAGVAAVGALSGAACRCVPMDLPEPMRLAASASMAAVERPMVKTTAKRESKRFMSISCKCEVTRQA